MIAGGDGRPMLDGLKVIDMTSMVFGPYCTQILADFGAEVTKVENPAGDTFRVAAKPAKSRDMGPGFIAINRGKKSVVLDLKQSGDADALRALLADADVFIHNVRADGIERLGFGYDAVRAIRPDIVYTHCVGFGSDGPYAGLQAFDDLIQAASGATTLLPRADGSEHPRYLPSLVVDKTAGLHAAYATMAAIIHRMRTGDGQFVEVPMFELFTSFLLKEHLDGQTFEPPNGSIGNNRELNPDRQPFRTSDGWVSIVPYSTPQFLVVVAALGDEALAREERFKEMRNVFYAMSELYQRIGELTQALTTAECLERLRPLGVPCMPVRDLGDILEDPHLDAVNLFEWSEHPSEGRLAQMREPSRFSGWQPAPLGHAPRLGQHDDEVKGG